MASDSLIPLDLLRPGDWADVADVDGDPNWVCRLAELGVRAGCRVQMLQGGAPCMLRIAGCKLCLRADELSRILVRPVSAGPAS